jgi:1,4-alpha-glucan branching enzyme
MSLPSVAKLRDDGWLTPFFPALDARRARAEALRQRLTNESRSLAAFAQGHKHFGLHRDPDGGWVFRDWAPNATQVFIVGPFNNWEEKPEFQARRISDSGHWELRLPTEALNHGDLFRLRMHWEGGQGDRLPAWIRRVVQNEETLAIDAQVWAPTEPFIWKNQRPRDTAQLLIYEAHAGMAQEQAKVGSWDEFRTQTLPRIKAAGYNTVQLMAVQEHPYYGSFGYHVSSFFAPTSRFGTPEQLKALIDEAHSMGIRVIMDLVHSHAVKNEVEGISRYDGTLHQFFHDGPRGNHHAWDSRCFDYARPEVLHFLLSNIRYWIEEFQFDGFRFDGVTSMLYHDHGLGALFTSYDDYFGDRVDQDAVTYLTLATSLMHELAPDSIAIAEDVSGMAGLAAAPEEGGMGFDYRLSMGVPDTWFKFTDIRDDDWNLNWLWHELTNHRADERVISYVESHDQALVGGKSFIFTLIDADMYWHMNVTAENLVVERGIALHKLARLATLGTAGHGYLTFMGNEFGHPEWVDFPREGNGWSYDKACRKWSLRDNPELRYYQLAEFDQAMLALVTPEWAESAPHLIKADEGDKILAWRRADLLFIINFHPTNSYTGYGFQVGGQNYELVLSSDQRDFGGHGRVSAPHPDLYPVNEQGWLQTYLPHRSALVFRQV